MAANMTGMRVEGTAVIGKAADRGHRRPNRSGAYGIAAAAMGVLALAGLLLWVVHGTGTSNTTTAPASVGNVGTSRGQAGQDAIRFVEENTITLPSVSAADVLTPMMSEQQRTLEASTSAASTVPYYRTIAGATDDDRPVANGPASYMEPFTPLPGQDR